MIETTEATTTTLRKPPSEMSSSSSSSQQSSSSSSSTTTTASFNSSSSVSNSNMNSSSSTTSSSSSLMKNNKKNKNKDSNNNDVGMVGGSGWWWIQFFVIGISIFLGMVLYRNHTYAKDPISFMIPNLLMFTPFKGTVERLWDQLLILDDKQLIEPKQIPEIYASEYTYERLREITNNFRRPAVVRGLFSNTTAINEWIKPGYVSDSSRLGDYIIPVVEKGYHDDTQDDRIHMTFRDAYEEILANKKTLKYLFFPVKSKVKSSNSTFKLMPRTDDLIESVNQLTNDDLDLQRLFPGFGTSAHKTYMGAQMLAGNGQADSERTTGSFWHCAVVNNWFIQVAGVKHWQFLAPEYSAYLYPQRNGVGNMATGSIKVLESQKYVPTEYVDLRAGDLLYNPEWQWHRISNYEGLSIGIPIREMVPMRSMSLNMQYFWIVMVNVFLEKVFGISYGLESKA